MGVDHPNIEFPDQPQNSPVLWPRQQRIQNFPVKWNGIVGRIAHSDEDVLDAVVHLQPRPNRQPILYDHNRTIDALDLQLVGKVENDLAHAARLARVTPNKERPARPSAFAGRILATPFP
jgi:hypothetical protein